MNGKLNLYKHNKKSYKKIEKAFSDGESIVGIVHATGTGKTYNALQLAYNNKYKKILYIVPSIAIIDYIQSIIKENDLEKEFSNIEFKTYQSLVDYSDEELKEISFDLLIIDEFHHIGAPIWGEKIETLINTHPESKIFGMSAYTVRDRGTAYERDMAGADSNEIFSGKIVSRYDVVDAMKDGVLPVPIYRSVHTNLLETEKTLEDKIAKLNPNSNAYKENMSVLEAAKRRIASAPGIAEVMKKNIKPDGKYIYFCPTHSQNGKNDITTIKQEAMEWFKAFIPEEEIVFYTTTSDMNSDGKKNRDAFYNDETLDGKSTKGKLRVMFAINQYNEGIHAPNVDGVIMGRGTSSDIVFYEQLGRALSVGNDSQNSPVIIDLANNFEYIKELENNFKNRVKLPKNNKGGSKQRHEIKTVDFDIDILNHEIYQMLSYVRDRLTRTWEDVYGLAKAYYENHGDLEIVNGFKTINGYEYDVNGFKLGVWITTQRTNYKNGILSHDRIAKLNLIGMRFTTDYREMEWQKNYELAKIYFEHHKDLEIPFAFRTKNGYEISEDGIYLGHWIANIRKQYQRGKLSERRIMLLREIGMRFLNNADELEWQKNFLLAKEFYEEFGNLEIPFGYKIQKVDEIVNLGYWINTQRTFYQREKLSDERIKLLESIGMVWSVKKNRLEVLELCGEYNIDIETNKKVLNHIPLRVLKAKINFLKANNFAITNDGMLHEIFAMSNLNVLAVYQISLEDLVKQYGMSLNKESGD